MLEILAPAGNVECALAAIDNGANAIYVGLEGFSARQGADNFSSSAFSDVVKRAHFCGVKVYVAMNTLVKDTEIEDFIASLLSAWNAGADAVILQDIFLGKYLHAQYPKIHLHLSTQAGVCTVAGARLAKEYGFSRVILARETPLSEIAEIAKIIETEVFVQGALCTAFSGQCYFSSFVGGNSGNRGRCKQPCRKLYSYDRNGNTEKSYALSLSDLSVGEQIEKLIGAGVSSFKIEGRMRRAEYVAAATRYYRELLDGQTQGSAALSDLKRTYNRGNYTCGLAFGQDKRFLSTAIQGHIGEKVGVVKVVNGKFLVESAFKPQTGDAFKILREGKEVAGAVYVRTEGRAFVINAKTRLKNGDGVFVTTDTAVNERLRSARKRGKISLSLRFEEGKVPQAACQGYSLQGKAPLQSAQNRPLSVEEVKACFLKTDGLPIEVNFEGVDVLGNIFMPKSELNAFRRAFYEGLANVVTQQGVHYALAPVFLPDLQGANGKTAVITDEATGVQADIVVYKAADIGAPLPETFTKGCFEKYLYYPAYATEKDIQSLSKQVQTCEIEGIYAENYAGLEFAKAHRIKLFAGTGFNLFNRLSVATLLEEPCVAYYALSKELNEKEGEKLCGDRSFALSSGNIKLMDLCYCPFGKTCGVCDKKFVYHLTDEGGRVFPVRRYLSADGNCRFEVYNCADLIGVGVNGAGKLLDVTLAPDKAAAIEARADENKQKQVYGNYTSGHIRRGVL